MEYLNEEGFSEADLAYINEPFDFEDLVEIKKNNYDKTIPLLKA